MKGRACLAALAGAVVLTATMLLAHPLGGAARAADRRIIDLSADYDRARAEFDAFLQSPDRFKDAGRWSEFADRFREIYETDRGGPRADEALYMMGEVSYERHRVFRRREYLDAAIANFKRLLDTYRFSSKTSDTLVRLADIHYYNLDDPRRAYLLYQRTARDYPDTEAARRARVRMVAIEAQNPAFASSDDSLLEGIVPSARSTRPLPSPGAVLGGRVGGGRTTGSRVGQGASAIGSGAAGQGFADRAPGEGAIRGMTEPAPPPVRNEHAASPPPHPLLQAGPRPFKRPSDDLPVLSSPGP